MRSFFSAAVLLSALQSTRAQTYTSCNPLTSTSCPSDAALGTTISTDFTQASSDWVLEAGTTLSYSSGGANFVIEKSTDAPTITSQKYIFFGNVQTWIKAAPGVGIVSSFTLLSDDLDEIDWEWLGAEDNSVESNFFGKGNTTTYDRAIYHPVTNAIEEYHNYTIDWTSSRINWYIDCVLVRTVNYGDALALGGRNYPQTPMKVKLGNWIGCASVAAETDPATEGTCQWAAGSSGQGGAVDYSQAPFIMYVQNITVTDYGCGTEYTYGDETGDWTSIKTDGSCSLGGGNGADSSCGGALVGNAPSGSTTISAPTSTTSKSTASGSATTTTGIVSSTATNTAGNAGGPGGFGGTSAFVNSSTLTIATASTTASTTKSTSSTSSTAAPQSAGNSLSPKKKYGVIEFAVMGLGLALGYMIM